MRKIVISTCSSITNVGAVISAITVKISHVWIFYDYRHRCDRVDPPDSRTCGEIVFLTIDDCSLPVTKTSIFLEPTHTTL